MKDNKKQNKEPKKLYDSDQAYHISEIMIVFIGVCMILLAFLSLTGKVPKEYAFGATLAGFCFVYADFFILEEKVSGKDLVIYGMSLFLGVLSFILLPVVLLIFHSLGNIIMSMSDFFTFMAFGIVLLTMGFKTVARKLKQRNKISDELEKIQDELNVMKEDFDEKSRLLEQTKKELAKTQSLFSEVNAYDK